MSEAILQADLQRELLRLSSTFSSGDVTIDDWSILDGSSQNAPFVIIETADDTTHVDIQSDESSTIQIPFWIFVRFLNWGSSAEALRDVKDTIISALRKVENYLPASSVLGWGLRTIRSGSPVGEYYNKYDENLSENIPVFRTQLIILEVEETPGG